MDKIAANNHFVILRKEIKKAKAMVSGKLIRRIKKLKQEQEATEDETKKSKTQIKIESIHSDIKLLKTLDSYPIAKQATMKPDSEYWDKLASHSKATPEERLTALVICKNNIQKQVAKFRQEHKECDEWLEEYIEYREKKHEIVKPRFKKKTPLKKKAGQQKGPPKPRRNMVPPPIEEESQDKVTKKPDDKEKLHPSWESKRKQKELLKAVMSGKIEQPKRITFE